MDEDLDIILNYIIDLYKSSKELRDKIEAKGLTLGNPTEPKPKVEMGDIIKIGDEEGYVVATYEDGSPKWLMSVKEYGKGISWYDTIRLVLPYGWIIPTREQLFEVRNGIQRMFDDGMLSVDTFGDTLWSSSECSSLNAWCLYMDNGYVGDGGSKDNAYDNFRVRAFYKIEK